MSGVFGMPGVGGSLGVCALCGENFLTEIILHKTIPSFKVGGCEQTLLAHEKCVTAYEGKTVLDLPAKSVLRQAYEKQNALKADNE